MQESKASRDEGSPARRGEVGRQHRLDWRSAVEEHHHRRHHRLRERYGERQCLRDAGRRSVRSAPVPGASAKGRQPECGGKPEEDPTSPARESRDITDPVKRALGGALVPEVPPVEEALRRAQAPPPAPARGGTLAWERQGEPEQGSPTRTWVLYSVFIW